MLLGQVHGYPVFRGGRPFFALGGDVRPPPHVVSKKIQGGGGFSLFPTLFVSGFLIQQRFTQQIRCSTIFGHENSGSREKSKTSLESGSADYLSAIIASISAEACKKMEDK